MMSAAATDIIVEIINKIIDNIDKTVDDNKHKGWGEKNMTFLKITSLLKSSL